MSAVRDGSIVYRLWTRRCCEYPNCLLQNTWGFSKVLWCVRTDKGKGSVA